MNSLDPVYTVEYQLNEVLRLRGGLGRAEARKRCEELFEMVGIEVGRLRDYPHQFSGGMRQRVAIALALALNPKLVIADEPVPALDVIVQRQILDQLRDLQRQLGISVILVTHDISVVAYICDRTVVMYAGHVAEQGTMEATLTQPSHPYSMGIAQRLSRSPGRGQRRADADRGRAAQPRRSAARLPLRAALPVFDRGLCIGHAASGRG